MSIKLMSFVWDLDLPLARKMLLLSIADQANDAGQCWPELDDLAARCSMSRRTLFDCLRELEEAGFLSRIHRGQPGALKVIFQVNEDALRQQELLNSAAAKAEIRTGAKSAPVRDLHRCEIRTGAKNSTDPVRNLHSIKQPSNSNPKGGERAPGGTRLPPDWQPTAEQLAWAREARPELDIATEVEKFRDYWHGAPGARGRKSDWPATFRNWIRRAEAPRAAPGQPVQGSTRPAAPQRDWREPSETPLQRALEHAAYLRRVGALDEGDYRQQVAEAHAKHGAEATA